MTNKQIYYLKNRESILQKVKEYHQKNLNSQNYKKLIQTRKDINRLKDSVGKYYKKIEYLKRRIARLQIKKEIYELNFGKERSLRKRGNILGKKDK